MATGQLDTVLRHLYTLSVTQSTRDWSDAQLLQRFVCNQEAAAFTALVQRHGRLVWNVCRRHLRHEQDAEDAFQATFLVLARHAGSIRKGASLASWLYGVAYRTALKAKRDAARRHLHEKQAQAMPRPTSLPESAWRELQAVLDDEVERLPEPLKAPFVLCCLEGKSLADAARELGWTGGTVSGRLARARKQLKARLSRRGVSLSAVLSVGALAQTAAVPAAVAKCTVRAALCVAAGRAASAGVVPAPVTALVEGVSKAMFASKNKIVNAFFLLLGLCALGTGLWVRQALAGKPPDEAKAPASGTKPLAAPKQAPASVAVGGRVLDPAGKPVAGAKLYLLYFAAKKAAPAPRARTDAAGRFRFSFPRADVEVPSHLNDLWQFTFVAALAKGYGLAVSPAVDPAAADNLTLRLARDDVPIRGRVLNLQGLPVAGVTVRVVGIGVPKAADLSAWLKALRADARNGYETEYKFLTTINTVNIGNPYPPAVTDKEGRFTMTGFGRERVIRLSLEGPTIETREVRVRTRPGKTLTALPWAYNPGSGTLVYYGATFDHAAAPSRPIVGVVRDKDTGKPLAGVTVQSDKWAGRNVSGDSSLKTVTDQEGHYRLSGMPAGEGNVIMAVPGESLPYLLSRRDVPGRGEGPVTVNFALQRGVWIQGKVTDKVTGKGVQTYLEYLVFADNPFRKTVPGFATNRYFQTREDGSFRLVGLPGRGLVAVRDPADRYVIGVGADKIKGQGEQGFFQTYPYFCHPSHHHTLVEVNPGKDARAVTCPVVLDPGRTVTGTVVGPDGKPLVGAQVFGLKSYYYTGYWDRQPLKTASFTAYGLKADRPRNLLFLHEGKKLAGSLLVPGKEKGPVQVKLQPWGVVTGRLLDASGQVVRRGALLCPRSFAADSLQVGSLPQNSFPLGTDGKFRIEGLVPGLKYHLASIEGNMFRGDVVKNLTVKTGETKDLGDVPIKMVE
jgi:RNA polymerase sigma factor (sigma-70 family)